MASAQSLAEMAETLQQIVAQFKLATERQLVRDVSPKTQASKPVLPEVVVASVPVKLRSNGHLQKA